MRQIERGKVHFELVPAIWIFREERRHRGARELKFVAAGPPQLSVQNLLRARIRRGRASKARFKAQLSLRASAKWTVRAETARSAAPTLSGSCIGLGGKPGEEAQAVVP